MRKYAENTGDFNATNREFLATEVCSTKIALKSPFSQEVTESDSSGVSHKWEKVFARGNLLAYQDFFCSVVNLPTHVMIWVAQLGSSQIGLVINRTLIKSR